MAVDALRSGWVEETVDNVEAWRETVAGTFARADIHTCRTGFSAKIRRFERDDFRIVRLSASAHTVDRRPEYMCSSDPGQVVLGLQIDGHGTVRQNGRTAEMSPGDAILYDTSRPYTLVFDEPVTCLSVVVPRARFFLSETTTERLTAVHIRASDPVAATVDSAVACLEQRLAELPREAQHKAVWGIVSMVEMLSLHLAAQNEPISDPYTCRLASVLDYIDEHLTEPDLDPRTVADAQFMSIRALHNVAHAGGISIAGWIRRRRLERCRDDLANPALRSMSVAEIGARWGLTHPSHFCTLFRNQFGMTPSSYRQHALGIPETAAAMPGAGGQESPVG